LCQTVASRVRCVRAVGRQAAPACIDISHLTLKLWRTDTISSEQF
jgi:hypothetical protein